MSRETVEDNLLPHEAMQPADEAPREQQRVSRNVAVTMAARIGYMVTRIGIPPFVLAHIGLESYGLWSTIFLLVNYLGISTMGISNVYIKYVAEYGAKRQYAKANSLISTGLTFTLPLCGALFAALYVWWPRLAHWMGIPAAHMGETKEALFVVVGVFLSSISLNAFQDVLTGVQEIAAAQWFWVAGYTVEMVLLFVLVGRGRGIRGMAEAFLARTVLNIALNIWWAFRKLPWLRVSPSRCSKEAMRSVLHFGGVVQIQSLLSTVINSVERFAGINVRIGLEALAIFDLAKKWPTSISTVPMSFFNAFLPAASHLHAHTSGAERTAAIRELYLRGARQANIVSGYFFGLMALMPVAILTVWLGKRVAYTVPLFVIFNIAMQVHMLTGPGTSILRGIGRIYEEFFYLIPNIVFLVISLPISRAILHAWTPLGIGVSVCLSTLLATIVLLWRAHSVLRIPFGAYFVDVFWPGVVPYAVAAVFTYPASTLIAHVGRWRGVGVLLITGMLYSLVLGVVLDRMVLHENEKRRWRSLWQRALSRIRSVSAT